MSRQSLALSKDVCLFILDDVGIVFSEANQEIYELNTTATFIWCQLEEGLSELRLAEALASTFGFQIADAEHHVREAFADWRSRGFLAGQSPESPPKSQISEIRPLVATHPMPGIDEARDVWRRRHYRISMISTECLLAARRSSLGCIRCWRIWKYRLRALLTKRHPITSSRISTHAASPGRWHCSRSFCDSTSPLTYAIISQFVDPNRQTNRARRKNDASFAKAGRGKHGGSN